ncbi:MAG: transcriptional regulator, ArgR family, partial [Acidimicrobiaceae bacterium]|nr:transcriptional regulator, ArgR family [Acidimicrobiaceae bacterium]
MSRVPKNRRQHLVARLLADHAVTSQTQLVELLAGEGVQATQATVSRDLEELGAVRVRMPGVDRQVYAVAELPKDQVAPVEHLRRVLGEWVVEL